MLYDVQILGNTECDTFTISVKDDKALEKSMTEMSDNFSTIRDKGPCTVFVYRAGEATPHRVRMSDGLSKKVKYTWEVTILQIVRYLGEVASLPSIYRQLERGKYISLTTNHLRLTPYGNRPAYQHQTRGHISDLLKTGDLVRSSRGIYAISDEGKNRIKEAEKEAMSKLGDADKIIIDEKGFVGNVSKSEALKSVVRKYALDMISEYISEAEHMDGLEYWNNFEYEREVVDDFVLYLKGDREVLTFEQKKGKDENV